MKVAGLSIAAGASLAVGVYALVGALYGMFWFRGDRAAANILFWLPLAVLFIAVGALLAYLGLRESLLQVKKKMKNGG